MVVGFEVELVRAEGAELVVGFASVSNDFSVSLHFRHRARKQKSGDEVPGCFGNMEGK